MQPASSDRRSGRPIAAPGRGRRPTPIPIPVWMRNLLILLFIATLALVVWFAPIVLVVALGGFAVAMVLSVPCA